MDALPYHVQKQIAQYLSIEDITNCFLAHRSFHHLLKDMTRYDGWTFSGNLTQKLKSLRRYIPHLTHLDIHVYETAPIPHKHFLQLAQIAREVTVSLYIHLNITLLDKLRKTKLPVHIKFLSTSQQQLSILDHYPVHRLHIYLHHGPFQLQKLMNYVHFSNLEHLTLFNFNEQYAAYTSDQLAPLARIPDLCVYMHGNVTLISYPLLTLCTSLAGVSLTTFALLSQKNLRQIILHTLESHLLIYHFELQHFLQQASHTCTLCLKHDALMRAEIAIFAKLFLDTAESRTLALEISERDYDRMQDICANLIYHRLRAYRDRMKLSNSRYANFTQEALLDELKALNTISYYTWKPI